MKQGLTRKQFLILLSSIVSLGGIFSIRWLIKFPGEDEIPDAEKPTPTKDQVPTESSAQVHVETLNPENQNPTEQITEEEAQEAIEKPDFGPRVVHVHAPSATYWDYGDNYYGNYVDQQVVNEMVDRGVMELTGAVTAGEAWQMLVPVYNPGKTSIAIKINMNNNLWCELCQTECEEWQLKIDAVVHPVNAVIHGLKSAYPNLEYSDIWVYDATIGPNPPVSHRQIPKRFTDACLYSGVRFFDQGCNESAGFNSSDPTANIEWSNPGGIPTPPDQKLTDVLLNATYLINMPILKGHGGTGVSLSAKNHFGSVDNCPPLHEWVYLDQPNYSSEYSPLIDIYRNPHIEGKTVLIIGDGLFGDRRGNIYKPSRWDTFGGNASNSLFFSVDPVAIDCVMLDLLAAEKYQGNLPDGVDDYLRLAAKANLGVYEHGDAISGEYELIDYNKVELS